MQKLNRCPDCGKEYSDDLHVCGTFVLVDEHQELRDEIRLLGLRIERLEKEIK